MSVIDIRGGLGTQVLQFMKCAALYDFDKIRVNGDSSISHVQVNWVSKVFDTKVPCRTIAGNKKTTNFDAAVIPVFQEKREEIFKKYGNLRKIRKPSGDHILHMRGTDNQFVSNDQYAEFLDDGPKITKIISDDIELLANVHVSPETSKLLAKTSNRNSPSTATEDWFSAINSDAIYGGYSTFILSVALLSPETNVYIFKNQNGPKDVTRASSELFEECMEYLNNLHWYE